MTGQFRFTTSVRLLGTTILILGACAVGVSSAGAQVYRCESAGGVPVYQGSANGRNCQPIDLAPLTTIPAPDRPASAQAAGSTTGTTTGTKAATAATAATATTSAAAAARRFPAVTPSSQRVRDDDRRLILEEELRKEQERLDGLHSQRAQLPVAPPAAPTDSAGEALDDASAPADAGRLDRDIERSESSLAALRRELDAIGPTRVRQEPAQ